MHGPIHRYAIVTHRYISIHVAMSHVTVNSLHHAYKIETDNSYQRLAAVA